MRKVAVYGTLKQGRGNHGFLRNAKFLGQHITDARFTMRSNGGFPYVENKGQTPITVEVYEITDEATSRGVNSLEGFNGIKGHPSNTFYDAIEIETPFGKADMFIAGRDVSNLPLVESGCW